MSRRAARRPRKSSCLYLSWAFLGWNKGRDEGSLTLRLFSTLLFFVICPSSLSFSYPPGRSRDGHSTASTIANFPFRAFYRVAIFSICHVSLYYRTRHSYSSFANFFSVSFSAVFLSFFFFISIYRSIDLFYSSINRELIYYYYYYLIIETKDQLSLKKNDFNSIKIYFDIRVGLDERRGSIIALRDEYNTPLRIHSPLITIITIIT